MRRLLLVAVVSTVLAGCSRGPEPFLSGEPGTREWVGTVTPEHVTEGRCSVRRVFAPGVALSSTFGDSPASGDFSRFREIKMDVFSIADRPLKLRFHAEDAYQLYARTRPVPTPIPALAGGKRVPAEGALDVTVRPGKNRIRLPLDRLRAQGLDLRFVRRVWFSLPGDERATLFFDNGRLAGRAAAVDTPRSFWRGGLPRVEGEELVLFDFEDCADVARVGWSARKELSRGKTGRDRYALALAFGESAPDSRRSLDLEFDFGGARDLRGYNRIALDYAHGAEATVVMEASLVDAEGSRARVAQGLPPGDGTWAIDLTQVAGMGLDLSRVGGLVLAQERRGEAPLVPLLLSRIRASGRSD